MSSFVSRNLNAMNSGFFKWLLLLPLSVLFLAPSCKKNQEMQEEDKVYNLDLFKQQKWFLSGEETSGDTVYFRPESYEFPPSRGREAFMFLAEEGKMTYFAISPTDFPMKMDASWKLSDGVLLFDIPGNEYIQDRQFQFRIVDLNEERLKAIQIY